MLHKALGDDLSDDLVGVADAFAPLKAQRESERVRFAEATPPSLKTRQWVRSRMIAYAKARRHG
jgi:hypothetical protein